MSALSHRRSYLLREKLIHETELALDRELELQREGAGRADQPALARHVSEFISQLARSALLKVRRPGRLRRLSS